jgi:hypothetical protein
VEVLLEVRRRGRIGPLEIAAGAAVVAVLAVLASGSVDAGELASGRRPAVLCSSRPVPFAAAVVASRFLPGADGCPRDGARDLRLRASRSPALRGRAGIAAAFPRSLSAGRRRRLPLTPRRANGPGHVRGAGRRRRPADYPRSSPCSAPRRYRYAAIPGVEAAYPILRSAASAGPTASVSGVTVLGAPEGAIRGLPLWRGDWGTSKNGLADAVAPHGPTAVRGATLAASTIRVAVGPGLVSYARRSSSQTARSASSSSAEPTPTAAVMTANLQRVPAAGSSCRSRSCRRDSSGAAPDEGQLRRTTTVRVLGVSLSGWLGEGGVTVSRNAGEPAYSALPTY